MYLCDLSGPPVRPPWHPSSPPVPSPWHPSSPLPFPAGAGPVFPVRPPSVFPAPVRPGPFPPAPAPVRFGLLLSAATAKRQLLFGALAELEPLRCFFRLLSLHFFLLPVCFPSPYTRASPGACMWPCQGCPALRGRRKIFQKKSLLFRFSAPFRSQSHAGNNRGAENRFSPYPQTECGASAAFRFQA